MVSFPKESNAWALDDEYVFVSRLWFHWHISFAFSLWYLRHKEEIEWHLLRFPFIIKARLEKTNTRRKKREFESTKNGNWQWIFVCYWRMSHIYVREIYFHFSRGFFGASCVCAVCACALEFGIARSNWTATTERYINFIVVNCLSSRAHSAHNSFCGRFVDFSFISYVFVGTTAATIWCVHFVFDFFWFKYNIYSE